jgi:cell division transport system ATP-binding protein
MIHFQNVSKRYERGGDALKNVNLHVESGEMVFLTGHSGAGKSTLLRLLSLVERATRGQVIVGGKNLSEITRSQIPHYRRNLGIVFQSPRLLTDRTVFDNVALPLVIAGHSHKEITRRVRAALDLVGLLGKERAQPIALSGGEQQRVGIARAVVHRPPIVLADEPTGNLDPILSLEIMTLFERFQQFGVTALIVTHDLELLGHFAHRILSLRDGMFEHA